MRLKRTQRIGGVEPVSMVIGGKWRVVSGAEESETKTSELVVRIDRGLEVELPWLTRRSVSRQETCVLGDVLMLRKFYVGRNAGSI